MPGPTSYCTVRATLTFFDFCLYPNSSPFLSLNMYHLPQKTPLDKNPLNKKSGLGMWFIWQSSCLACARLQGKSPALSPQKYTKIFALNLLNLDINDII